MEDTALTQVIKEFERLKDAATGLRDKLYLDATIAVCSGMLIKEREQIEEAYTQGQINEYKKKSDQVQRSQYFNNNFTQYKN